MERRGFLASLFALPLVGLLRPANPRPLVPEEHVNKLLMRTYDKDIAERIKRFPMLWVRRGASPYRWERVGDPSRVMFTTGNPNTSPALT